jgi:aspartate/methionine/tyrosine aminotransferase
MNLTLQNIPHYLSKKISDLAVADPDIVNLSIGEPYFGPPQILGNRFLDYVQSHLHTGGLPNKYAPTRGEESLRQAISQRYQRLYDVQPNPESEVLITHGAIEAIWLSILCLTNPGEEILIPDPTYNLYETAVRLLERIPVRVPTRVENGFVLDPSDVKSFISAKTKLLFINSPENPTGAAYPREVFQGLGDLALHHGFYLVHDEVYDSMVFRQAHYNLLHESEWPPYLVLINSFSKRYSMMGWRLGWMAGPEAIITAAVKAHTNLTLNLVGFHQTVAGSLLNDPAVEAETAAHVQQIERQLNALSNALDQHEGFQPLPMQPKGGLFLFPNILPYFSQLPLEWQKKHATPGEVVAAHLLQNGKVAVVPGYVYGPSGANHVRLVGAVAASEIERACQRFQNHSLRV